MKTCHICESRRPRRFCPGVRGDICAPCCGTEREVTVDCPFDCEYLLQAREHDKLPQLDPNEIPNKEIRVTDSFLRENEALLVFTGQALLRVALETPSAVDSDAGEALASLVRTYQTLESGLYYETRPANPLAAVIQQRLQAELQDFRRRLAQRLGVTTVRDADILGILVLLQRLETQHNNGRRRSRAFIHFLHSSFLPEHGPAAVQPLILP